MIRPHRAARILWSTAWVTRKTDFRLVAMISCSPFGDLGNGLRAGYARVVHQDRHWAEVGFPSRRY